MIGRTLGHNRLLERIGSGGMGVVYRARDVQLERDVVIKVLPGETVADPVARARLLREARSAAALNHPRVCTIHEVGEDGGQVFIAMELVEGRPLSGVMGPEGMPPSSVLRNGVEIADALAHAHGRHVIHRDLKSANVMVTSEGHIKVLDFGLARRLPAPDASTGRCLEKDAAHRYGGAAELRAAQPYARALVLVGLDRKDEVLTWLEKGVDQRTEEVIFLKVEPAMDPLRSDPRLAALLRRLGFAP